MTYQSEKEYIEAKLAKDRAELSKTTSELRRRLSVGSVAGMAVKLAAKGGWKSAALLTRGAKANPVGFTLIGAGLAWIFYTPAKAPAKQPTKIQTARWEDEGGSIVTKPNADLWSDELDALRKVASDRLYQLEVDAKSGLTDAYGKARDFAYEKAEVVKEFAADLNRTLGIGIEHLSGNARLAALKARERTYTARMEAERLAASAATLTRDHPLIMGVVGLGIGATLAALMPRVHSRRAELMKSQKEELRLREAAVALRERRLDAANRAAR